MTDNGQPIIRDGKSTIKPDATPERERLLREEIEHSRQPGPEVPVSEGAHQVEDR
jgi:hypothetical protein